MSSRLATLLLVALLTTTAHATDNPNPFARTALTLSGGYQAGVTAGIRADNPGILQFGELQQGNFALQADFPIAGKPDATGGYVFSMGPRVTVGFQQYAAVGLFVFFPTNFNEGLLVTTDFDVSAKNMWSFPVGSGFIAPYFDLRLGLKAGFGTDPILGANAGASLGVQHFFTPNWGWSFEMGANYSLVGILATTSNPSELSGILNWFTFAANLGAVYAF